MKTKLVGQRVLIRRLRPSDASEVHALRQRNRAFLQPYEPYHPDHHFTYAVQLSNIMKSLDNWEHDNSYGFGIFLKTDNKLVGRVSLSNVSRGAWQSCTLGYFMNESHNGQGLTTEAVSLVLDFAFTECSLHRVQAAIMPHNQGSIRVVEKLGFNLEGLAKYYLKINGEWTDHLIYSLTKEFWQPA